MIDLKKIAISSRGDTMSWGELIFWVGFLVALVVTPLLIFLPLFLS